jgi:predicted glutamine amidotransferase
MCAIIGWSGKLPKGLLSRLLMQAETRGRDSTGVAFRTVDEKSKANNLCYRQIVPARTFTDLHKKFMGDARRSIRGIAHTRRASPGMPIDNTNAHPYTYPYGSLGKYFFAHNGRIHNWTQLKADFQGKFKQEYEAALDTLLPLLLLEGATREDLAAASSALTPLEVSALNTAQSAIRARGYLCEAWAPLVAASARLRYMDLATTDSMVLGPCIENRDFSKVVGCMGLVWMRADKVYVLRYAKEAVAANIIWKYKLKQDDEPDEDQMVTVVASTPEIISDAIAKIADSIDVDYSYIKIDEGRVYRIEPTGLEDEGRVPMEATIEDEFSSAPVEDRNGAPLDQFRDASQPTTS